MKVVINEFDQWFFSLSALALKELVKRQARCFEVLTPQIYYGGYKYPYKEGWEEDFKKDIVDFKDIGDGMSINSNGYILKDGLLHIFSGDSEFSERTDKDVIEVIEMLGKKAHGTNCKLKIVEIPDGIEFYIYGNGMTELILEVGHFWN